MKIIALSDRRKGLCAVTLEDKTELLIDAELVFTEGLAVGKALENTADIIYKSDLKRAKSRAMWYLSRADHSEKALLDKLKRGGFSEKACLAAVDRMKEIELINDERYARHLAEYLSSSGISRRELYGKLILKGVPSPLAKEVVSEDESDETEKIKHLITQRYSKKLETEDGVQKVFIALSRKGFSFGDIKDALKQYSEELENSEEF